MMYVVSTLWMSLFAGASWADQPISQGPATSSAFGHGDDTTMPNGVIGIVIQVGAERIGEPAALYVLKVRRDGPAQQARLRHGDEIVAVNGIPVKGKSYEQVASMIRGEAGTPVKLEVRGTRELSITRVAGEKVMAESQDGSQEEQVDADEQARP